MTSRSRNVFSSGLRNSGYNVATCGTPPPGPVRARTFVFRIVTAVAAQAVTALART